MVRLLDYYKKHCTTIHRDSQLILPDAFKLLPLYSLGLFKSHLISPLRASSHLNIGDARSYYISLMNNLSLHDQSTLFHSVAFEIHSMAGHESIGTLNQETGLFHYPGQVRMNRASFHSDGVYLIDSLETLFLWVGEKVSDQILNELLSPVQLAADINSMIAISRLETDLSIRLFDLVTLSPRLQRCLSPEIFLIREGSSLEQRLTKHLIEDGLKGSREVKDMNYMDYLSHLHKSVQIQNS